MQVGHEYRVATSSGVSFESRSALRSAICHLRPGPAPATSHVPSPFRAEIICRITGEVILPQMLCSGCSRDNNTCNVTFLTLSQHKPDRLAYRLPPLYRANPASY